MPSTGPVPLIGVTMYRQVASWGAWERDAALVPAAYIDLVVAAGGQPVLIPPFDAGSQGFTAGIEAFAGAIDGLMLVGGGDVNAERYGQPLDPRAGGLNDDRDEVEFGILSAALSGDLPVLAICRGHQLLNVFLGGDLIQHLPDAIGSSAHQPRPGAFGPMLVTTEPGSIVRRVLGERTDVLCSHHQAIGSLGADLSVTARSHDGVIEAIELPGHRFVVGVQWHPEESSDGRLIEELIESTRTGEPA